MLRPLLSPSQRSQLFNIPEDILEQDLVRRYTFSPADLSLINRQREAHNRLGFAVQLAYLRFPGRPLQALEQVPYSILNYVALQLNLSVESLQLYARRDATRREHGAKIQRYLSLRQLTPQDELEIGKRLLPHAVETGSNFAVIVALLEELRARKIVIPSISTVERIADSIQDEATRRLFGELTGQLNNAHKNLLDCLLALRDRRQTHLIWLKNFPRRPTPQNVLSVIDRIGHIDSLQLPVSDSNVYENRLSKLARQESRHTPQYIQRLDPIRRYGTLVAIVVELRKDLIDQLITMHDKMIGQFFNRSQLQQKEAFHKRGKAINEKVLLYAKIAKALIAAKDEKSDWQEAISDVISWEQFRTSVEEAEELSVGENFDYLENLRGRYSYLRQYVPHLLATLPIDATPPAKLLLEAVGLLKQLNETGKLAVPETAPTEFIKPRWEPYIFQGKEIDRQYYELHVLSELRNLFRSGDLWVAGSREHKRFDTYLLSKADWEQRQISGQTGLAISTDGSGYLTERTRLLHQRLSDINRRIGQNALPEVTLENGTLHITKLEKSVPDEAVNLAQQAYSLVPPVKLTDLLVEVDSWTHFSDYFTRDDDGIRGAKEKIVLFSAILADATNLGLRKMAQVCPDVTLNQLAWVSDYYIREEIYQKALSEIINFHHLVPFAAYWGGGKTSSSDGQQFPVYSRKGHTAHSNAKYGPSPSAMFYTHISDQYSPYFTQPISATVRDATHVIDGLLHHQTDLQIEEHYTDTAGYTDHVFALCHLLGFRFRPRIRDLADKKLYAVRRPSEYKTLEPLIGGRINERQILNNWPDLLRLAGSIKAGTVTASLMLRKLGAYPRQNGLAYALRELGRIERTLFILDYLEQPRLRLQILMGLNKGEARNALARAMFFYRRSEIMDRTWSEQYNSASGLNLVVAAIILWNTVYLAKTVEYLKQDHEIPEIHLKHISPVAWEHISLTGDYIWNLNPHVREDGFRSLSRNFLLGKRISL